MVWSFVRDPPTLKPFETRDELIQAVDTWIGNNPDQKKELQSIYGPTMNHWDVSRLDDFSHVFNANRNPAMTSIDEDVSLWTTGNGQNFEHMF